jgi:hypothetical protein
VQGTENIHFLSLVICYVLVLLGSCYEAIYIKCMYVRTTLTLRNILAAFVNLFISSYIINIYDFGLR